MKEMLRISWLALLLLAFSDYSNAQTILKPIVMDYGDISGQGNGSAETTGCTFPGDCMRITWELNCVCVPTFPGSVDSSDLMAPFSLHAAALVPLSWPNPTKIIMKDPWRDGPWPGPWPWPGGPFPNPGPGPFDPTPTDVIIWADAPDVALQAASENGTPPGMKWVGLKSSQVVPNSTIGNSLEFRVSFVWEGMPLGSEAASGKLWFSDNTDNLFGTSVISTTTDVGPSTLLQTGSIGTTQTFASFEGAGFSPNALVNQINSDYWDYFGFSDGPLNYGDFNVTGDFARGLTTGSVFLGGIYAINNGYFRGMLIQPTNSDFTPGVATTRFQNNSADTIHALEFGFDMLVNNDGVRSTRISFLVSEDGSSFTPVPELDVFTPDGADFTSEVHTAGRTMTGLNIAPGDFFYMRWDSDDFTTTGGLSRDEFALSNIFATVPDMDCDATVPPVPTGAIDRIAEDNLMILDWENFPGSVGCQVNAERISPPGPSVVVNVLGMKISNFAVPAGLLTPGATYQYRTRCACELSPIIVSPWSSYQSFTIPAPRLSSEAAVLEVYPNPASETIRVVLPEGSAPEVLRLFAMDGRLAKTVALNPAQSAIEINVSELQEGLYQLVVDGISNQALMISR